ncbi:L-tryptophan decarboxylase-like [Dendronephthya gigantea]|uniref:L-tryptophan decarboxylase-like n=1 Tax=Dendronephthya gigantea TaxID=151771 RepID=UPI00106D91AE|nr:L-tryptophan decarboxylase-like [Dendronephthya gigantea]
MSITYRLGHWVTADIKTICRHVKSMRTADEVTRPSLLALKDLIETDPEVNMLFSAMFTYEFEDPDIPENPITDYMDMLLKFQEVISKPPGYTDPLGSAPINHILIYVMATPAGTMAFINDKVNKCFKDILNDWAQLLNHEDSKEALNSKDGWLCPESLATMPDFLETYQVDLTDPLYYGFKCWNDYFARKLRTDKDVRPVANKDDPLTICSPCEAFPYFIERNPQLRDEFWIKAQPYSLQHLLDDDALTEKYVGGTVYQAFLDTANYHRWHAPVDGKITKAYIKEGAYYAEALSMGYDPTANTHSQRYLCHVDTRAIIHIDTGNPALGTVIFIAVGMAEISSCPIEAYYGQEIKKGDPLGTFLFGGSTYVLLFEKHVHVKFAAEDIPVDKWPDTLQLVNSEVGKVIGRRHPHHHHHHHR